MNSLPFFSFPVIAIGASAGGSEALWALFAALPKDLAAAVLVVIHIPAHSESILDEVLGMTSVLPVKTVEEGKPLRAGWVSKDGHQALSTEMQKFQSCDCRVSQATPMNSVSVLGQVKAQADFPMRGKS